MDKIKKKKCADGKVREFARRRVMLSDVWNGMVRQYEKGGEEWNTASLSGNNMSVTYWEGYMSGLTVAMHFLRHYKDKETFELPANIPEYMDLDEVHKRLEEDLKNKMDKIADKKEKEKPNVGECIH